MPPPVKLGLIFCLFASWGSCFTKFRRPQELDPDQEDYQDMMNNKRYDDGQPIPILFDTNIKKVNLFAGQVMDDRKVRWFLVQSDPESDTNWKAQYDINNVTEDMEDCIYTFVIRDGESGGTLAQSQYVNVSAPKPEETKTITVSTASTTLTTETTTSTTDTDSSEETNAILGSSSKPGLSRGGIAGVAVGATIASMLILGGIGWIIWRRRARRKDDATLREISGNSVQDRPISERPKSELPAEPTAVFPESPRSPPGFYEAP
ncbi:unnamed protein product [Fusarium equiseti]|uniref:Mid2 domain-containing protein n=1 Tax=Fusarium equiseti TaxID=61235 RepID=A0A8J2ND43_FUSEQ|nr:unnamed protein product [Fusarium equiseti]